MGDTIKVQESKSTFKLRNLSGYIITIKTDGVSRIVPRMRAKDALIEIGFDDPQTITVSRWSKRLRKEIQSNFNPRLGEIVDGATLTIKQKHFDE